MRKKIEPKSTQNKVKVDTTKLSTEINLEQSIEIEKDDLIQQLKSTIAALTLRVELLIKSNTELKNESATKDYDFSVEDASKYKSLIDSSPDSILTLDLNNIIQFASLTDKTFDLSTIIGHNILEYVSTEDKETLKQSHLLAIKTREPQSYEISALPNDSSPRYFMTKVGPIISANKVVGLTLIARDITKRKIVEKKLEESLSLLEATIESTADGILVADKEGKITLINKKFVELWQIPNYIIELKDDEAALKFVLEQLIDPESFISKVRDLYSNHDVTSFDILHFKDGRVFERYSQAQLVSGVYAGRVWSFRNVTEQIHADEALKKSQLNFEQAQSIAKMGSWEHNFITGRLTWSKELYRMFDLENEPSDSLFKSYKKRIHPDDLRTVLNSLHEGIKTGKEQTIEHRIVFKNAATKYIRGIGQAILNDQQQFVGLKGTGQDITKEKEAEEKIKHSLHEKEILLKEIHHRVKNNLQIISSILNLQAGNITDQTTLNLLRDSQSRIKCMSLVHELLFHTEDFASINFSAYTSNIANNIIRSYNAFNQVQLNLNVSEIYLDLDIAISCGLIINELVTNSLKYGFKGIKKGELTIEISQANGVVNLTVADNGIGLPSNFDFRNTESLGMQLVVSLVSQIDGTIDLDTTAGTKFEILFSVLKKDASK